MDPIMDFLPLINGSNYVFFRYGQITLAAASEI